MRLFPSVLGLIAAAFAPLSRQRPSVTRTHITTTAKPKAAPKPPKKQPKRTWPGAAKKGKKK